MSKTLALHCGTWLEGQNSGGDIVNSFADSVVRLHAGRLSDEIPGVWNAMATVALFSYRIG